MFHAYRQRLCSRQRLDTGTDGLARHLRDAGWMNASFLFSRVPRGTLANLSRLVSGIRPQTHFRRLRDPFQPFRPVTMAYPVPIALCDACNSRRIVKAASFTALRGHGDGFFCADCRELIGEDLEQAAER